LPAVGVVNNCAEESGQVVVGVAAPVKAPEDRRAEVGELACRVNYNRRVGCLEMDMSDGEVRFRAGIDVEGGELTETMIRNLIGSAYCGMDRYMPTLLAFSFAGTSPEAALAAMKGT
jgi:hypothetical protein